MISYNQDFQELQSYLPTTIITNYHQFHAVVIVSPVKEARFGIGQACEQFSEEN